MLHNIFNSSPQKIIPEPIASYSNDFIINISFTTIELKRKSISELVDKVPKNSEEDSSLLTQAVETINYNDGTKSINNKMMSITIKK